MRVLQWSLVTILLASPVSAQAQARLPLADAVAEAVAHSPEIAAAVRHYDAARQRPIQARSLPDPMLSAGFVGSGRPWPGAGLGVEPTANIGVMVSQDLPYSGTRTLRASVASREADAELERIDIVRLALTARVKQAYYRLAYAHAVGDVLARNRDLLDTLLKVSENRYAVGKAAQQDVIKAQTELSILELQIERIQQERATREGELNALLARPATAGVGQPDDLELTPFDLSLDALLEAARTQAPSLRRDRILIDRAQLAVDVARQEYKPELAVTGGYAYMGAMPAMYELRVDVKIPLQRARRNAFVAEQRSAVEEARQTYDVTRLDLQGRIVADHRMASTSVRLAGLYRDTVLPQARLALESSMTGYQTGAVDFLSVLTNFGTVLQYEMTYFDELASYHAAVSRLEEMTGAPLVH